MEIKKIGTQIYAVNKGTVDQKLKFGKILIGKIKSYQTINGELFPVVQEVGTRKEIYINSNYFFGELVDAVNALTNKKKK
jgi:hypothetical protein